VTLGIFLDCDATFVILLVKFKRARGPRKNPQADRGTSYPVCDVRKLEADMVPFWLFFGSPI
jgi:hypothetical protein